jgi:HK97 gp10 family phage protein
MLEIRDIQGLRELDQALKAFPLKVQKNVLSSAVRAAAKPIIKDAKTRAPKADEPHRSFEGRIVQPGNLRKTIRTSRIKSRASQGVVGFYIGPLKKKGLEDPFYWVFLEEGTKHIEARPFLKTAFDSKVGETIALFKKKLFEGIEKKKRQLGFPK